MRNDHGWSIASCTANGSRLDLPAVPGLVRHDWRLKFDTYSTWLGVRTAARRGATLHDQFRARSMRLQVFQSNRSVSTASLSRVHWKKLASASGVNFH